VIDHGWVDHPRSSSIMPELRAWVMEKTVAACRGCLRPLDRGRRQAFSDRPPRPPALSPFPRLLDAHLPTPVSARMRVHRRAHRSGKSSRIVESAPHRRQRNLTRTIKPHRLGRRQQLWEIGVVGKSWLRRLANRVTNADARSSRLSGRLVYF
jgi:hypothetical protein